MMWSDVDVALAEVPVNVMPLIDDTNFKSIEDAIAYDAAGMSLVWNFYTSAGAFSSTAVTPTTGGLHDWAEHTADKGMYTIEIPASGGTINNDTKGFGWFTGVCTGVLPWRGPVIEFRKSSASGGSSLVLGAGDVGDFKDKGTVHFFYNTIDRSGAAIAPSVNGTVRVYKDDGTGEVTPTTGITVTRAFDGVTGLHEVKIDTSVNAFYAKEKNYSAILVAETIDTKVTNAKVASFSIENRWANVHFHYGGK